jgi:predicted metalloprotease
MKRTLSSAVALFAALLGVSAPIVHVDTKQDEAANVSNRIIQPRIIRERDILGGFSKVSHRQPGRFLNQRQYRKKVRQNRHLLNSKKHRSKN